MKSMSFLYVMLVTNIDVDLQVFVCAMYRIHLFPMVKCVRIFFNYMLLGFKL